MTCKNGHPDCGGFEAHCNACLADKDARDATDPNEAARLHTIGRWRQNDYQEKYGTRPQGKRR